MTNNADGSSLDAAEMKAFIDQTKPDVLALQTWAARHQRGVFGPGYPPAGWNVHRDGELFFASRYPIADVRTTREAPFDSNDGALAAYDVQAPFGDTFAIYDFTSGAYNITGLFGSYDGLKYMTELPRDSAWTADALAGAGVR